MSDHEREDSSSEYEKENTPPSEATSASLSSNERTTSKEKDMIKDEVKGKGEKESLRESIESSRSSQLSDDSTIIDRLSDLTSSAMRFAKKTTGTSIKVGKAIIKSQDQLKLMVAAGESLRDLREVAGLTINELNDALKLKDKALLEAVENGTATLSFELILRLAALLARNDPIPFILKYTRTYNPEIWKVLHDWGLGRLPLHFERERKFINIYRAHDEARKLSDEGYDKVLEFTRKAFELSLHFIAEQEKIEADDGLTEEERIAKELREQIKREKRNEGGRS